MSIRKILHGAVAVGLAALAWGHAGSAAAARELEPIKIGAISTLVAGPTMASPGLAAKAVFDSVNASGGIQKRKLVFLQEDDQGSPAVAAEAAARLISDAKVVALAGGASFLECAVNAGTYEQAGVVSLPGLGLERQCFSTPMIAPVNTGPEMQFAMAMHYATGKLGKKRLCVARLGEPAHAQKNLDVVLQDWVKTTGNKPVLDERDIRPGDSPEPFFKKAGQAACEAIVFAGPEDFSVRFALAGKKAMPGNVPLITLGVAYTSQIAETLGRDGDGIYAMSEFEPWSSRSGQLSQWRALMIANQVPLTSGSQGGYLAAQILVKAMRGIKGDINRESVTRALQQMPASEFPMLGMPFAFGGGRAHHPNQAVIPVQLIEGRWRIAHHEWLTPSNTGARVSTP